MSSDVYPYMDIIEGMHVGTYGLSLTEFTKALSQQLENFITGSDRVKSDLYTQSALGSVLDSIGNLVDKTRILNQSDISYRDAILQEVATREQSTISALTAAINNVIGVDPIIDEYPTVDFVADYGLKRNEGALRITIPGHDSQYRQDVMIQADVFKAAGIAIILELVEELIETFTELLTLEELLIIYLTVYTDDLVTLTDVLAGGSIESFLADELLTTLNEQLSMEGEMYLDEDMTIFDIILSHEGILYLDEDLTTLNDVLAGGSIESFFTELLLASAFDDSISAVEIAFGVIESITPITDVISHEGVLYDTEDLTTLTDVLGGGSIDDFLLPDESMPSLIAIIGSAIIGTNILGTGIEGPYNGEWDNAWWDVSKWDNADDKVLVIREAFP